ncbi:hypothetical protein L1049_027047 [Liquidambar formosana]|uniref:Uncharacterized protein n=1 Tax=Liquidambar formosana TaxID=63359 RepID=A0AAP0R951_LIQFO
MKKKQSLKRRSICISTFHRYLYRLNVSACESCRPEPLVLEEVVDFQDADMPIGMGGFVLESKLYMVEGEKVRKGIKNVFDPSRTILDESNGSKGLNGIVFVCDSVDPKLESQFSPFSPHPPGVPPMMNSVIAHPIVVTIKGKVYVLAREPIYSSIDYVGGSFWVFDPTTKLWDALPDPPFYERSFLSSSSSFMTNYFVLGHMIMIFVLGLDDTDLSFNVHA